MHSVQPYSTALCYNNALFCGCVADIRLMVMHPFAFALKAESGWGEFEIQIKLHLIDPGETVITLFHFLKLYEDEGGFGDASAMQQRLRHHTCPRHQHLGMGVRPLMYTGTARICTHLCHSDGIMFNSSTCTWASFE